MLQSAECQVQRKKINRTAAALLSSAKFVVFNSIQLEKSVSTNAEKRVTSIPTLLTTYGKSEIPQDSTKYIEGSIFVFPDKSMANVTVVTAHR